MYNQSGVINGVKWSVTYLKGDEFQLTVGHLTEKFTCDYPMTFGMDISDVDRMNHRMDEMQEEVESDM